MTTHRFESRSHFWDSLLIIVLEITLFIKKACNWLLEIPLKKANKLIKLVKSWRDWYWKVPATGIVAFAILFWIFKINLAPAIFLAAFTAFLVTGPYVFNTERVSRLIRFVESSMTISIILFVIFLIGLALKIFGWPNFIDRSVCEAFVWPMLITSSVLFIVSAFGAIAIMNSMSSMNRGEYGGMYE